MTYQIRNCWRCSKRHKAIVGIKRPWCAECRRRFGRQQATFGTIRCEQCKIPIPDAAAPNQRFCSTRCSHAWHHPTDAKPSRRGLQGTRCPLCNERLSFDVAWGVAYEVCPNHGIQTIPIERRHKHPHDQRARLVKELKTDVANECKKIEDDSRRGVRGMQAIRVGAA